MKPITYRVLPALTSLLILSACTDQDADQTQEVIPSAVASAKPIVVLETNRGTIKMELEHELADETVANFLLHVRNHFYDSLTFHRVRPGFMIQAGRHLPDLSERITPAAPVANEAENGLLNVRGSVAMARTGDPHSATTEFFINLVDNPVLDYKDKTPRGFGYAVFGHVTEGMDVVDEIARVETKRMRRFEALPLEPIIIYSASIEDGES